MRSFWTRRRAAGRRGRNKDLTDANPDVELTVPNHFRCPITLDLMKDPVTLSTGITYDRESIEHWIEAGNCTCPITNQVLRSFDQIPNHTIRKMIQNWCVENRSHGVERIPTPRIPVTRHEVLGLCSAVTAATSRADGRRCRELVGKMKRWARESERNKKCVVECGTGCVLSASFEYFASVSIEEHADLLMEILSALIWMFPLGEEGQCELGSEASLRCMAWFLSGEDLSAKQNAVLALKQLLSLGQQHVDALAEIGGVAEALVKIIEEPISPTATKAALMTIHLMISPSLVSERMARKFVELGLVSLILEILVDAEKGICEKSLGVMERLCSCDEGRERAQNHALTMPVLVKKILRVSTMATEFSVCTLWKLCKSSEDERALAHQALQVGAFQKLLVVLQVGCGERTKEKATELLKLLIHYKDSSDCFDSSMDFKYLKRPH